MGYQVKPHLDRAKTFLLSDDVDSLRYASLELRLAIEAHVYNQLKATMDKIPESVINTWQPQKAIKLLCEFEETADMDLHVTVRNEGEDEDVINVEYKNIKSKDLNKWYNSIGSNLHQPTIRNAENYKINKKKLIDLHMELERIQGYGLIAFSRPYRTINCEACHKDILYNDFYIKEHSKLECQSQGCKNYYLIKTATDGITEFTCSARINCWACNEQMSFNFFELNEGFLFKCKPCGREYEVRNSIVSQKAVVLLPKFNFDEIDKLEVVQKG